MKLWIVAGLLCLATASFFKGEGFITEEEKLYFRYILKHERNFPNHEHYLARFKTFKSHLTSPLPNNVDDISMYADMDENIYMNFTPDDIDWKQEGKVPTVMNQGQIDSSLAIAITEAVESAYAIKTGKLISLNVLALQQCVPKNGDYFTWTVEHGIPAGKFKDCNYISDYKVKEWKNIKVKGNDVDLYALLQENPVVVYVDASQLMYYMQGVIKPNQCGKQLDHVVLLTGFSKGTTEENGPLPYFTLQNSWGTSWGESGLFRVEYGMDTCGVADIASYPIVD